MSGVKDSLIDLERHRQKLEETANQLRKALQHWQLWDAEYETLKEEVGAISGPTQDALERIRDGFDGEVVTWKDIDEIFGQGQLRSKDDIISLLDRRIDYVTQSIQNLKKQLAEVEKKHAVASVVSQPDAVDEDGQPITDIVEELDDEDNVVAYRLNKPGISLPHVREALAKAGVKNLPDLEQDQKRNVPESTALEKADSPAVGSSQPPQPALKSAQAPVTSSQSQPQTKTQKPSKKGVSFSEDTKPADESPDISTSQTSMRAKRVQNIVNTAKEQERASKEEAPVIPDDEDPEDAALRRQMLNYNAGEIGAVVAELSLEEFESGDEDVDMDYSDDDVDMDFSGDDVEEEEDDEDKYGRTTSRVITDQYRERMLELEKKLGIKSRFTDTPSTDVPGDEEDSDSGNEGIGRIVVNRNAATTTAKANTAKEPGKKGVRFAESLNIAPVDQPAFAQSGPAAPVVEPISDIVERSGNTAKEKTRPSRGASRFKQARAEGPQGDSIPKGPLDAPERFLEKESRAIPTGPEGMTIADSLVERDLPIRPRVTDNEFNDFVDQGELASEHNRLRNKFMQREGGFLRDDEPEIQPVDETGDGRERMSRFKAARLSRQ